MPNSLDAFFTDKIEHEIAIIPKIDKVLCIVEGGDELSFIKKVYKIYNQSIECQDFISNKIKLSYGKNIIEWQGDTTESKSKNRKICNFQGGDNQDGKAPLPILASLNNEDLELYKAIIVMFDKDRDFDNVVEVKSKEILEEYSNKILFLANPCFEKNSMTFFMNEKIEKYINDNYSEINYSSCRWFKKNYSNCIAFNPIGNAKKLARMIDKLEKTHLENSNINEEMSELINFIKIHIGEEK